MSTVPDEDKYTKIEIANGGKPTGSAAVVPIRGGINVDLGVSADGDSRIVLPETLTLEQMLKRFVHVSRGPMIVDVENTYRQLNPREFTAAYAHNMYCHKKGDKAIPVTKLWQTSPGRLSVDALGFHPGERTFYRESGIAYLNLWIPPNWPAMDPEDALEASQPFFDHLTYLIPDELQREDYIDWLAHIAQKPAVRPHWHPLSITSTEGTGRNWAAEVLTNMWGKRHAGSVDLHALLSDPFNSILSAKVLMNVHEVKAPADERYSHKERLKSLLTDTSIIINEKKVPRWIERFCTRFNMFTNKDDALPVTETDRRIYAIRCADEPRDAGYYKELYSKVNDPRLLAGLWECLCRRDISKFNPGMRAPLNEMKIQLIAAGRTEDQQTAAEFVRSCPFDVVGSDDLMEVLAPSNHDEKLHERRKRTAPITAALRDIGCQTFPKKIRIDGVTQRAWILRRPGRWAIASSSLMREQAENAHQNFKQHGSRADDIMESWRKPRDLV